MSDQRRKKNPELNTSRSGIGSAIIGSAVAFACLTSPVKADEGGVSFWLPGELWLLRIVVPMRLTTAPDSNAAAQATAF